MNGGVIFLTVFSYIVGGLMLWSNLKEYKEFDTKLQIELKRKKYECYDFGKSLKVIYGLIAVAGLAFAIYGYIKEDFTTSAIGVVTAFLFVGQAFLTKKRYRMYYDDEAFVLGGERINFKTISDIKELRFVPFAFKKVVTFNGKEYAVSSGCLKIIEQKKNELRDKKKESKKKQTVQ
jgi:predicted HAD superfamily phosphohydrolase